MPTTESLGPKKKKTFVCTSCHIKKTEEFGPDPIVQGGFWESDFDGRCHSCRDDEQKTEAEKKRNKKREKYLQQAKEILDEAKQKAEKTNEDLLLQTVALLLEKNAKRR